MPISNRYLVQATTGFLVVGFLALFAIVGMTVWLGQRAQVFIDETTEVRAARIAAVELRDALRTAESSQRGFLLTGNEIYLAPFDTAKGRAVQQFESLKLRMENDAEKAPMLQRLATVVYEKFGELDETIALARNGQSEAALAAMRTNRGKALMDEANVFLYGIILSADEFLIGRTADQQRDASMLRWVAIIAAFIIIIMVGGVTFTVLRHAREVAQARDEVRAVNLTLEDRVQHRTADLALARQRAEILLTEVNHRVANSLQLVAALVKMQANTVTDQAAKSALAETQQRIYAIGLIHKSLYSSGDVRFVALDDYLRVMLEHLETSMRAEGRTGSLRYELEPVSLRTDAGVSLGVVVTEWVTNAFKYAYPDRPGEIRVRLKCLPGGMAELVVEDDGVGRRDTQPVQGTGLGSRIVNVMGAALQGKIDYIEREKGTAARIVFAVGAE